MCRYAYMLSGLWKLSAFPSRFCRVAVDVSAAFPLGNWLPDKCYPKTPAAPTKSAMTNTALYKTAVRKTAARKTAARLHKVFTTPSLLLLAQLNCLLVCVCWYAPVKVTREFGTRTSHCSIFGSRYTLGCCACAGLYHWFGAPQVHFPLTQKR